jgi:hypothetical protein
MSRTLVQRFYEVAKLQAEMPALGLEYGGAYHDLPWWFVKSKAKHFGMGLLEAGAREGEYFYLLASEEPEWIYAELGALTVGLKTLPLPKEIPATALATLFKRFPPAFFLPGNAALPPELFRGLKGFHRLIHIQEDRPKVGDLLSDTFRRVFNSGIRCEAKHHSAFRRLREGADLQTELSPIRVDQDGLVRESSLRYGEVNEMAERLNQAFGNQPLRRLMAKSDLSRTSNRIACLYWPILQGAHSIVYPGEASFQAFLKRFAPQAVLAPRSFLKEIAEAAAAAPEAPAHGRIAGLKRRWDLGRRRKRLGLGSLRLLLHSAEDADLVQDFYKLDLVSFGLE